MARRGLHSEEQPWQRLQTSVLTSPEKSGGDGWPCVPVPVTGPVLPAKQFRAPADPPAPHPLPLRCDIVTNPSRLPHTQQQS